ncbi:MAG: PQQ-like beta-propeller repeat protein [Planctomycetaceae bacterium]|nr:PQQ-like beta-propeller repeat protein [Planctomycetaceae bacterium]MDG2391721.1 PQQ-like beta-propeller repeat protein [Planctomycetaceae bacterium]
MCEKLLKIEDYFRDFLRGAVFTIPNKVCPISEPKVILMQKILLNAAFALFVVSSITLKAADWTGFRGSDHDGVIVEEKVPTEWSETKNLKWTTKLPGKGTSSPIILGDRVYLTCYEGYGENKSNPGSMSDLKRHLIAINRKNGEIVWKTTIDTVLPEDQYSGFMAEHGYASQTPVSDGERIYAFFGKSGVYAFDMSGKVLWKKDVGQESSSRRWGSGASPILYGDLLIVNASDESQSIRAFNKVTGEEVWKAQAAGLELTFNTPRIIKNVDGEEELIVAVPYEVWGMNPKTGKLTWYAECDLDGNVSPTIVAADGIVYAVGGRNGGMVAVKTGGKEDVTKSHILWSSRETTYVPSPILHDGKLYWVSDRGQAYCLDAKTGETVYRERLSGSSSSSGRGGSRGFYASVVLAGEYIYAVNRKGETSVYKPGDEFKVEQVNSIAGDEGDFNASPAIANGQMFLRSDSALYCIGE